ncbi:MAG: elongation factor P [Planctomycetota bacterium]
MGTISTNQFSNGITLRIGGELFDLVFFEFVKPGKGSAFVRTKLRSLRTGSQREMTFDSKDKVEQVVIDKKEMEYLYREGEHFVFMDPVSFDQTHVRESFMKELLPYLKENTVCDFKMCDGEIISVALPDHMVFQVVETTPWVKGSTAAGGNKPATIDTGTVIQVPVYLNQGEYVRVDTRTGKFADRAKGPEG